MDNSYAALYTSIVSGIVAIITLVITNKNSRKEKELDFRLTNQCKEIERRFQVESEKHNDSYAKLSNVYSHLYGYLWSLMYAIDADRINIVQPHPENNRQFISVSFEILHHNRDASPQKMHFQNRDMAEWGSIINKWINNEFLVYKDVSEIKDIRFHSEAFRRGIKTSIFHRLTNPSGYWLGTLAIDYTHERPIEMDYVKGEIKKVGFLIADILPEYKPKP